MVMLSLAAWKDALHKTAAQRLTRTQARAADAWWRINEKPTSVTLKRNGVLQPAQTVRIDVNSSASPAESAAGMSAARKLTIFGVRGHATIADTDIRKGDRVVLGTSEYTVLSINEQNGGEVQAYAESIS